MSAKVAMKQQLGTRGIWCSALSAFVVGGALFLSAAGSSANDAMPVEARSIRLPVGVSLFHPEGWSAAPAANVYQVVDVPSDQLKALDGAALEKVAFATVYTEQRTSSAEAVSRLKEIEAEVDAASTFLTIGGWPALERQYKRPRPLAGADPRADAPEITVVTTAVAVNDVLVRVEAWVPEGAPTRDVEEVVAMGRSLVGTAVPEPSRVEQALEQLRKPRITPVGGSSAVRPSATEFDSPNAAAGDSAGATVRVTAGGGRDSEIEVAVANGGSNIVVGTNNGWNFSTDAGQTWAGSAGTISNDPSVAWGSSGGAQGTFYIANINSPSTDIRASTNGGANFAFRGNAYTCPTAGDPACGASFPDQEHIAADRFNVTATGDQVYSAWRHLNGSWGIVCSNDGGATWSTNGVFTAGDFPRVTVGQDGFVYVTFRNGNNIGLSKFNSCETNQSPMVKAIADQTVATITNVACPTPGLDRCNFRNDLASAQPAVDDTNANHIYVAYAANTSPGGGTTPWPTCANQNTCNENIIVQDSLNGGVTWNAADPNRRVVISSGVTARRFMPWICVADGTAHVTWYDRRAASPGGTTVSNNSLTDFYRGSASLNASGNLTAGTEAQVNQPGTVDAQCEAGAATGTVANWPSVVDNPADSESCSLQPQLGGRCCVPADIDGSGRCLNPSAASSAQRCDFTSTVCPGATEVCSASRGSPKYGDYNGCACEAGRLYAAWASAVSPASITPASTDIDLFVEVRIVGDVPQIQIPGNLTIADTCAGATGTGTLNVCNTGTANLEVNSVNSSDPQFVVITPTSGLPVVISPDFCFPFQVEFTPTSSVVKSATLTVTSNDPVNPSATVQVFSEGIEPNIASVIANSGSFGDVCLGDFKDLNVTISNSGNCPLTVDDITSTSAEFDTPSVVTFPLVIGPKDSLAVPIRFEPSGAFGPRSETITIHSDDPDTPERDVAVSGNVPPGDIRVTGSTDFGQVCAEDLDAAQMPVSICNVGKCNLNVSMAGIKNCTDGDGINDFELVKDPFPAKVSPDFCIDLMVRFKPSSCGPKTCELNIMSDDPDSPVVTQVLTGNTPCASIDVPDDVCFPPTVIQAIDNCESLEPFPVSNTSKCNLTIENFEISDNPEEYSLFALPSFPIILDKGHVAGDGDLRIVFAPDVIEPELLQREHLGEVSVTYVSDPVTGDTMTETRSLCGESVRTGARVLVMHNGVPLDEVKGIRLLRINANRNRTRLDTVDVARNLPLQTVTRSADCACPDFQFHREYGTVTNPIQLLPGSYEISVMARIDGKMRRQTAGFRVGTCGFNPNIVVDF